MRKKFTWIVFALIAAAELLALWWIRGDYYTVRDEGAVYITPAAVDFRNNFYENNHISLHIPITAARWRGKEMPAAEEEIYLVINRDKENVLTVLHAQKEKPASDYILVRAKSIEGDTVHFEFPAERLYMDAAALRKLSIPELAERVQVRDADTGRVVSRMKNTITAELRVRDGKVVIKDILVNGNPVRTAYTTVGTNVNIEYANGEREEDKITPVGSDAKQ